MKSEVKDENFSKSIESVMDQLNADLIYINNNNIYVNVSGFGQDPNDPYWDGYDYWVPGWV